MLEEAARGSRLCWMPSDESLWASNHLAGLCRYHRAAHVYAGSGWGRGFKYYLTEGKKESVVLLRQAIRGLEEKIADQRLEPPPDGAPQSASAAPERKVFIVHGHDEGAREAIARFLEKIGFEAIILHEQVNRGRTIIEKVETYGMTPTLVLLTPDDEGAMRRGIHQPRARQNVVLELGYFIGHLGRDNVCALKRGDLEIPSDFGGIVWETFDASGGWKQALGRELQAAGSRSIGRPKGRSEAACGG